MSEQNSNLDALLQERDDLDAAIEEARLVSTDDEEETPEVESPVTETPTTTQTEIIAAINKAEAEGRFTETVPLKVQLLEIQNGHSPGLSQIAPTAAPDLPSLSDLTQQIAEAEAAGNYSASSALKSQVLQNRYVGGHR